MKIGNKSKKQLVKIYWVLGKDRFKSRTFERIYQERGKIMSRDETPEAEVSLERIAEALEDISDFLEEISKNIAKAERRAAKRDGEEAD
jgi:hypothetical protein